MNKNIFKKVLVVLSLGFILFTGSNVFAAPVVAIIGDNPLELTTGVDFVDPGARAVDDFGIEIMVEVSGSVNKDVVDSYIINYTATDGLGGVATSARTVNVINRPVNLSSINIKTPAKKINYFLGEELDISGLIIEGTYSDNTKKDIEITNSNIKDFDSSTVAVGRVVTVTVEDKIVSYTINIEPNNNVSINLKIISGSGPYIYDSNISVKPCDSEGNGVIKATPYCALEQAGIKSTWSGLWINSIDGISNDWGAEKYWTWITNLDFGNFHLSSKEYELKSNDKILFYIGTNPLKISDINLTPEVGSEIIVSVKKPDYTPWPPVWVSSRDSKIIIGSNIFDLDSNGEYKINILNTESFTIGAQRDGFINSPLVIINPVPSKSNIFIRSGDQIIYEGTYNLPEAGVVNILDNKSVSHEINSRSVLAIINSIDTLSDNFSIPNFEYNSGLGSLYLKCLTTKSLENLCNNWQYVVGGEYPHVGMDKNILSDNTKIYIYFGPQNKTILSSNSINTKDVLSVTSKKYNYEKNIWDIRTGVTIGVTKPNPADPWTPDDSIKSLVDSNGIANFSSLPVGVYDVGIKEDYYWPTEKLTVVLYVSNGGGISNPNEGPIFDVSKALDFLNINKNSDGSYGSSMYTDWVAVAAGAGNNSSLKSSLASYLKNDSMDSSVVTDYERRAMALMALGINPYTGTDVNYIEKIVESFDGTQFGDISLINDDIFALIVLKNSGYKVSDEIIKKDISYVISNQSSAGSWGSIDMTAAGIQALNGLESIDGVSSSISKGEFYLISNQRNDDGFDNSFSTSWALQSMYNNSQVVKSESYLTKKQQEDGGMEDIVESIDTRVWSTAYAIPAILHKTWDSILKDFSKPVVTETTAPQIENTKTEETLVTPVKLDTEIVKEVKLVELKKEGINTVLGKKVALIPTENRAEIEVSQKEELDLINSEDLIDGQDLANKNIIFRALDGIWGTVKSSIIWLLIKLGF